jgi:hypothetical protein
MLPHVNTVRTLFANGMKNLDAIAEVYDVHPGTIKNIVRGKTFGYIPVEENAYVNASVFDSLMRKYELWSRRVEMIKNDHRS